MFTFEMLPMLNDGVSSRVIHLVRITCCWQQLAVYKAIVHAACLLFGLFFQLRYTQYECFIGFTRFVDSYKCWPFFRLINDRRELDFFFSVYIFEMIMFYDLHTISVKKKQNHTSCTKWDLLVFLISVGKKRRKKKRCVRLCAQFRYFFVLINQHYSQIETITKTSFFSLRPITIYYIAGHAFINKAPQINEYDRILK